MAIFSALTISAMRQQSSHRADVLAMFFGAGIDVLARISLWKAVYGDQSIVSGITLQQMVTYAVVGATLLSSWDASLIVRDIGSAIRSGQIGNLLIRPASFPAMLFAEHLGFRLFNFAAVCLPIIIIFCLGYGISAPVSLAHALLFIGFVGIASTLLLLIAILFGLLSFWIFDSHSLGWFMRGMVALLSGGLVPLWFFPSAIASVARALPFSWISYYPMAVYLGQFDVGTSLLLFAAGIAWVLCLISLTALLWSQACRNVVVQGG
jgi:ABC-2 type transport system permease protein